MGSVSENSQPLPILQRVHGLGRERDAPAATSLLSASRLTEIPNSDLAPKDPPPSLPHNVAAYPACFNDFQSPSSEGGSSLRRSLRIDMKDLVGDAVGNMSISPTNRDVVLAARRGLFIIDLEAPSEIPRFLPQGGCWDVADVQWNPHRVRAEYIVSTSCEKLLIWNLLLVGKTSIEHILHSHFRAITDLNWHTTEPDIVVSTGIDSWQWIWDLREPRKPILGLSAFNASGTQVKWNRQDPHVLASSHLDEVLIWDRRKGSLPTMNIKAHNAKIYGIDWSRKRRFDIITCSLDRTIKVWDIQESPSTPGKCDPKTTIRTTYPIWRARDLPFGNGLLSLPQRGETALDMWAYDQEETPVHYFEGHSDVVKEFLWRTGGRDMNDFQLITWSKDRTLRFWPVDSNVMQRVGHVHGLPVQPTLPSTPCSSDFTFRNPPNGMGLPPPLSAPVGNRSILAEVRATPPPHPVWQPHRGSAARASVHERPSWSPQQDLNRNDPLDDKPPTVPRQESRITSRWQTVRMDPLAWLSSVQVGGNPTDSSGSGENSRNGSQSRVSSRSSHSSDRARSRASSALRQKAEGYFGMEETRDKQSTQSLQDEITSVIRKFAASKIKLEKHELDKRRTCTIGLQGRWGESSSVFMRVTFTFPKDYPQATHPSGTPTVELERNPLIPVQTHASILRRLRTIREQCRPCLEPCLRLLIFGRESEVADMAPIEFESSDDESEPVQDTRKSRQALRAIIRASKNLGEPRTSQGVFAPNGQLVCFFRAAPRAARDRLRDVSNSSSVKSSHMFRSPALVSDAVYQLALASADEPHERKTPERKPTNGHGQNILRIVTHLMTHTRSKDGPVIDQTTCSPIAPRRSVVYIMSRDIVTADRVAAAEYIFEAGSVLLVCEQNAVVARRHGRLDHEHIFRMLAALAADGSGVTSCGPSRTLFGKRSLAHKLVLRFYSELFREKDLQMLAMLSVVFLQLFQRRPEQLLKGRRISESSMTKGLLTEPKTEDSDYFYLLKTQQQDGGAYSPEWPRLPSQPANPPVGPTLSSSNSSKGSWSSLFNAESMRQFVAGVQDTLKDGLTSPAANGTPNRMVKRANTAGSVSAPNYDHQRPWVSPSGLFEGSSLPAISSIPEPWPDSSSTSTRKSTQSAASVGRPGHERTKVLFPMKDKRVIVFDPPRKSRDSSPFDQRMLEQLIFHILAYADMLLSWQLPNKRLELLKLVHRRFPSLSSVILRPSAGQHDIGIIRICPDCRSNIPNDQSGCPSCTLPISKPPCTICRLPVKGLSRTCLRCLHITHVRCWKNHCMEICPTGCGCVCLPSKTGPVPSPLMRSPASISLRLP